MPTDSFIQSLAQGSFIIFALAIGFIVSLDVMVVEMTRVYKKEIKGGQNNAWTSRMRKMALLHASLHSISFLLYTLIIYALQNVVFDIFDIPYGVAGAFLVTTNFAILCFVWLTYRDKISEDHSNKNGEISKLNRIDMKIIVDLIKSLLHKFDVGDMAIGIAVAGSVAVDMLAISAIIKIYILPSPQMGAISTLTGIVIFDILIFSLIIFITVLFLVIVAQSMGYLLRNTLDVVVFLRVLEPFGIFFIVAGATRYSMTVIGLEGNLPDFQFSWVTDAIFSAFIVLSLYVSNGLSLDEVKNIYKNNNIDEDEINNPINLKDILQDCKKLLPGLIVIFITLVAVLIALIAAYSTNPGKDTHNHIIEATGYIATILLILAILFIYCPSKLLDKFEVDENNQLLSTSNDNMRVVWLKFSGAFIALLVLALWSYLIAGFVYEVGAIFMWSFYLLFTWGLFNLRKTRFENATLGKDINVRRQNDANFSELVSALGYASSIVALVGSYLTATLDS